MLQKLMECFVYLLAVYGLLILAFDAAALIRGKISRHRPDARVVLLVRNAEEYIEYVIRDAARKDLASGFFSDKAIVVVDMNSSDHTYKMLEKLQKDFPGIEILRFEERELIFEKFSTFPPSEK